MGIMNNASDYHVNRAIISYTDASFLSETREFEIKFDPHYYEAARKRADGIMLAYEMRDIQPEGWIAGGKECQYCPFSLACGAQRRDVPEEGQGKADPQFVAEIADLARKYKFMQLTVEGAEKQVRELQTEIKTRLQDKKIRRIVGDGVSVSWNSVKGREIVDVKALRTAAESFGIDTTVFVNLSDPSDRLTVLLKDSK